MGINFVDENPERVMICIPMEDYNRLLEAQTTLKIIDRYLHGSTYVTAQMLNTLIGGADIVPAEE